MLAEQRENDPVETAIALAEAGYHVAPVTIRRNPSTGRKMPVYHGRWSSKSTTDPDTIRAWASVHGHDLGFCIDCERSGVVVVDLDVDATEGVNALEWWAGQRLPLGSMIVNTPSGGIHHYFRAPETPVYNSAGAVAAGVDVRGIGGHVFAPGSYVTDRPDRPYSVPTEIVPVNALAVLPAEIIIRVPARRARRTVKTATDDGREPERHDGRWIRAEMERQLALVREHQAASGSGFRTVLLGAAMVWGRAVNAGIVSRGEAEGHLEGAVAHAWRAVADEDDLRWIADGLDDGEADPWIITVSGEIGSGPVQESSMINTSSPRSEGSDTFTNAFSKPELTDEDVAARAIPTAAEIATSAAPDFLRALRDGPLEPPPFVSVDEATTRADPPTVPPTFAEQLAADRESATADEYQRELDRVLLRRRANREADAMERAARGRQSIRDGLIDSNDLGEIPPPAMLMGELIPAQAMGFLGGDTGTYKSFLAVSWACSLASGRPWQDRDEFAVPAPVRVLYVAAEGAAGVAQRVEAWKAANVPLGRGRLVIYPRPINLTAEEDVDELASIVADDEFGLVVIDTLHRSTGGIEENSSGDFGLVFERLAAIRDRHEATILFLDHTGHEGKRLRGTSSKGQDADFVIMAERAGENQPGSQRRVTITKRKDLASEGSWNIRLAAVPGMFAPVVEIGDVVAGATTGALLERWWEYRADEMPEVVLALAGPGSDAAREIVRVLRYAGSPMTISALLKAVNERPTDKTYSDSTVRRGLKMLHDKGVAENAVNSTTQHQLAVGFRDDDRIKNHVSGGPVR